jgi:hypothetical protein
VSFDLSLGWGLRAASDGDHSFAAKKFNRLEDMRGTCSYMMADADRIKHNSFYNTVLTAAKNILFAPSVHIK